MHKGDSSEKAVEITSSLAIEANPQVNPYPYTTSILIFESSIRRKEGVTHALPNEVRQESLVTIVPLEQLPRVIQTSPTLKAPVNIATCNKFASLVVDLSEKQVNDMEKLVSPMKSLLSSKVKNIYGISIGTTRKKKQKQKSPNQEKVGVPKA
ncbi:unnamed protein product [Ilex paraguariensis]|uniref:Uncharacterized protein n=1 Tax=Ilex paraguariensis TaxID=185542 RepID=A0ABC8RWI0_9AQUA